MPESVEPVERGAVMVVRAGAFENVADVDDPTEIVRVHISEDELEPPLLPPVVRRVAEGGEREGSLRVWCRRRNTPRGPDGRCDHRNTGEDKGGWSAQRRPCIGKIV